MQKSCRQCEAEFEIADEDLEFYEKVSPIFSGKKELIPPPTMCPLCRQQRRMMWRNERTIFRRSCDLCKKQIIAQYHPDAPYHVFCHDCFWSDRWNAGEYARSFDQSKSFFSQFQELLAGVPLLALINTQTENSEYCHRIFDGRNCYLSFIALYHPEDLLFSYYTITCKNCTDISLNQYCELCFETVDAERCYQCLYGSRIRNCRNSAFLEDCTGCSDCFGCKNLHQKQYCIFNEQKTKEEYEDYMKECQFGSWKWTIHMREKTRAFFLTLPYRSVIKVNAEYCSGSYIFNSRNCINCFDTFESEHMKYCVQNEKNNNCHDICGMGGGSFSYEGVSLGNDPFLHLLFCASAFSGCSDLLYCYECYASCHHCFGCVSLRHASYCIFNKQYSKDEYEALVPKIIAAMRERKEYGEFFPADICPFAYNETAAQAEHPLMDAEILGRGWKWRSPVNEVRNVIRTISASQVPDSINDVSDDVLECAIACGMTARPFKIAKHELEFYRKMRLPVPRFHPDERHRQRMALRNPRQLWERSCQKCSKTMTTSFSPERPEIVYCESCYLSSVY